MSAPDLVSMAKIELRSVEWLWKDRFPLGKVSLLVGDPGDGKTLLSLFIAARASRGEGWPDGAPALSKPAHVILLSAEDDPSDTLGPRLKAAGADLSRIDLMRAALEEHKGKFVEHWISLLDDLEAIEYAVKGRPGTKLVIIDTLSAYLGRTDTFKDSDVRRALGPLAQLAAKLKVAVVAIAHCNKSTLQKSIHRVGGSIAIVAQSRACWLVGRDPDDPELHLLLPMKANLTRRPTGLAFRVKEAFLDGFDESVPVIEWEKGTVTLDPDAVLSGNEQPQTRVSEAFDWLREQLQDGPVSVRELESAAEEAGIKKRTLDRAKRELRVKSTKRRDGRWMWELPPTKATEGNSNEDESREPPRRVPDSLGDLGKVGNLSSPLSEDLPIPCGQGCHDSQVCQGDPSASVELAEDAADLLRETDVEKV